MTTQDRLPSKLSLLTQSERECLRMVAQHLRSKEIARNRGTSPYTVNRQIESACKKLGAATRQDAARIWLSAEGDPGPILNDSAYEPIGIVNGHLSVSVDGATEAKDDNGINTQFARNGDHQLHLETARTAAPGTGGRPGTGSHGAAPGFGPRETISVSRGDLAAERDHEDGGLRRGPSLQAPAWTRKLSPRAWIVIFAISAFGGAILLAGILSAVNASMALVSQISGH
jgi:DNA-binding CsgD family transcriptional regulator